MSRSKFSHGDTVYYLRVNPYTRPRPVDLEMEGKSHYGFVNTLGARIAEIHNDGGIHLATTIHLSRLLPESALKTCRMVLTEITVKWNAW